MADISRALENARFKVLEGTPFQAYMVKGKQIVNADQRAPFDLMFSIRDLIADRVMLNLKPSPKMSSWARKIPMDVIEYGYKMVGYQKSSFVWDVSDQGAKYDYVIVVVDDAKVQRSPEYQAVYVAGAAGAA